MYDKNDIITNQFVRIKHDTVGVGPRFFAHIIDVIIIFFYGFFMIRLYDYLDRGMHFTTQLGLLLGFFFLLLPILTYFIVSETVTGGQTIGKFIMGIKVMKADGTPASMGNYLMRGMLLPVETYGFFYLGAWFMLITKRHQRLGDLAAGTMVVRVKRKRSLTLNLNNYRHLAPDYQPLYKQAEDLSVQQVEIIKKALKVNEGKDTEQVVILATKVRDALNIKKVEQLPTEFLKRIIKDYEFLSVYYV